MNPANFHNMAGPSPGPQGNQQQAGPPQNLKVQHHIFRMLQQQQPPRGWQTAVALQQRTLVVWQLVSSLRLIKPDMDIHQSINVAITFEQKTFEDSPDHAYYDQACRKKLQDITETRTKQAGKMGQQFQNPQAPQMHMVPQQMQMQGMVKTQNQDQLQPGFQNAQLHQAMQPSGMQMQQQLSQQPQSSLQRAASQHPPQSHIPQQTGQAVFTVEDQQQINRLAHILAQNTSKEQLDLIQNRLRNIAPEVRQNLTMQNIDPLTYYFRSQAANRYVAQKAQHATQRNQINGAPSIGQLPQQARTTPQNSAAQAAGVPTPQTFDSSQILAQQQIGLRLQEAGQVVVPASNSQAMVEPQRGNGRGTGQQPNGQVIGAQPMQNPTQPYYPSQPNTQQVPNVSMQPQAGNFSNTPNQAPQHNLQGQLNGLNNSGRTPQQNTNMPNLNRAFGSPNQEAQAANTWPQQRAQSIQQKDQNQVNPQQGMQPMGQHEHPDAGQQRPRPPTLNLPPTMQQEFAKMNEEQQNQFIAQLHRQRQQQLLHQQAMQQASARAQGVPDSALVQDQAGKSGPHIMGGQPGQMTNSQPAIMQNGNGLQQPVMVQPPPTGQQSMVQQRQQQQQHQQRLNLLTQQKAAQMAASALTDDQVRQMDCQNFPAGILNMGGVLSTMPPEVKTWSELKGWVTLNQANLPQGSLEKLKGLQGLHYQNLVGQQRAKVRHGPNPPGQAQGQAPPAQMVAPPNNQTPHAGSNTPRMSTPNMVHSLPQPTVQEIQASRARLPDHLKGHTDEQIRTQILKQRQHDMLKIAQGRPGLNPQQQAQFNQLQRSQQQQAQPNQFQPPINPKTRPAQSQAMPQRKQPLPSPRAGAPQKDSVAKPPQPARAGPAVPKPGQANQKGIKRNSNDDVIEVPNPNPVTPATRGQPSKLIQASQQLRAGMPQNTEVQGQRAQLDAQRQLAAQQTSGPGPGQPHSQGIKPIGQVETGPQRTEEQTRKEAQLQRICTEVAQSTPRGDPVPMAPQTRSRMLQILGETTKILSRIPSALPIFYGLIANEQIFRDLIRTHILVAYQYRDKKYEHPVDHFTISLEVLDASTKKLSKLFNWLMGQIQSRRGNQAAQVPGQPQNQAHTQQPQPQPSREAMPALNAANLQQQQLALQHARAANLQRNHSNASVAMQKNPSNNSSRTPAAPTSTQPPFSFGGQPPHGVPQAYGERPNELTQDKLQIPSAKRRKGNQAPSAGSTPILARGTPAVKSSPQVTKLDSPGAQRPPPASVVLRCPDPDCAMSTEEFMTRANLDAHQKRIHPNFNDPLEFCLESIRMGLNLDANGKNNIRSEGPKVDAGNAAEAAPIQRSASTQGQAKVKQEATTPMTRALTQTGPSPASNLLITPQTSNVKTPASGAKPVPKNNKAADSSAFKAASKTPVPATHNPWAGSDIPASMITSAFSGLSDLQSLGPWSKIQNTLTPDSTLSSGDTEKNSPRPSDISENDAVNISINVNDTDWMPSEWFMDGMGGMEALNMDQELEGMDWGFDDAGVVETGKAGKGKEKRDDMAPSPEWLKIWAPDKL